MSDLSDISSLIQNSLLLTNTKNDTKQNHLKTVQAELDNLPSVLDEQTLTKLKNGEYEISLKEYTNMSTYNTMMTALYGNKSANAFQDTLGIITKTPDDELATAKSFVNKMKESGMSNKTAIKTYSALKKYSLMSSFGNYNFVNAKA